MKDLPFAFRQLIKSPAFTAVAVLTLALGLTVNAAVILRLVTGQGMKLTLVGLGCGLVLTVGLSHLLTGLLYGVRPLDPVVYGSVIVFIAALALFAAWLPARRAARVNPVDALRAE